MEPACRNREELTVIETIACHVATCDVCHAHPESDWGGVPHSSNDGDALEDARANEWWATADGTVLCDLWNTDHIAKAREIIASLPDGSEGLDDFRFWTPERIWDEIARPEPRFVAAMPGQIEIPTE